MTLAQPKPVATSPEDDTMPSEEITFSLTSLIMYAAATWDFHRYHYDADFVEKIGLPAPFVDGQMIGALLSSRLMRWAGPNAFVRKISYRQRATVYVDEKVILTGKVVARAVEGGRSLATVNLNVAKSDGPPVVRDGSAVVDFGPEQGGR